MSHEVEIYLNELPFVTRVGWYHVESLWKHLERNISEHILIYVLEGTFYISEDGIDYEVPKNHMIALKANMQHSGNQYIAPGSNWLWIKFQDINDPNKNDLNKIQARKKTIKLPKVMSFANTNSVVLRMKNILETTTRNEPYKQQQLNGSLYKLFMLMMAQIEMKTPTIPKKSLAAKVIIILKKQVVEGFNTEEIARELNLNYSYISRKFTQETGETIKRFYLTLKVNEAISLFQSTTMNVAQVSETLNFSNPYHFSRVFKQIKGVPPSSYRKQLY